jgi:hypothetical protein
VRDVRQERAQRDRELDLQIAGEVGDQLRERPPAVVRLDPDEDDGVAVGARNAGSEERVLRPLDLPRVRLVQRDERTSGLEVDEELGVDLRELLGLPGAGEVAGGERRRLAAVVPAPECGDQDRTLELRTLEDPQLVGHRGSLLTS